jgi:oleate hydratase
MFIWMWIKRRRAARAAKAQQAAAPWTGIRAARAFARHLHTMGLRAAHRCRRDHVPKKMSQATREEILTELIGQLGFDDIADEVRRTTEVTTVMMPYASALFSLRIPEDRPRVLPDRAENFAFLGQVTDLPEDVVFTVEYSVHGAMRAVYHLFGVGKGIPPIYHGFLDPKVGLKALESAFR